MVKSIVALAWTWSPLMTTTDWALWSAEAAALLTRAENDDMVL